MLLPAIKKLSARLRYDILSMTTTAGSGHPTSSLSAVELMAVLYFKYLRLDTAHPELCGNDRVIFSKGHASPLLYALFHVAGIISDEELTTYRQFGSVLEGHPTPRFPYAFVATGSLGQGLAVGLGEALALQYRYCDCSTDIPHVFVLMGDGELSEGAVWEAAMAAGYHKTHNLIAVVDLNGLEQSGSTMEGWDTETYRKRFESFGWAVIVVDGHDMAQLDIAYQKACGYRFGPTVIVAKTKKGNGISFLEGKFGWHGKVLSTDLFDRAVKELGDIDTTFTGIIKKPDRDEPRPLVSRNLPPGTYQYGKPTTTREGFGKALVRLGAAHPELVVFDGDLETSTYTHLFHEAVPRQFFQCHIAEQLMVSVAAGVTACGMYPVISSYGSFLTRSSDQLRMMALSHVPMLVNGSHGGVSVGADGPSQMGLEDVAMFRALPGSVVISPADAVAAEKLTEAAAFYPGIAYFQTTRPMLPVLYQRDDHFAIGGSHVFLEKKTGTNLVTICATGVTVHEALKAQTVLEAQGIPTRVIDCYSIKPLDEQTIRVAASASSHLVIVEDQYPEGGLGEAVFAVLAGISPETSRYFAPAFHITHLAVRKMPMSGSAEELLRYEDIDATAIVRAATAS